jgi:hypothetical protein
MLSRAFWHLLSAAAIIWYSTVTVYVAWNGVKDIKKMLASLASYKDPEKK